MAKKQRGISLSRATYERLKAHAEQHGVSMSSVVERLLADLPSQTDRGPK